MGTFLILEFFILFYMAYVRVSMCFNITTGFLQKVRQHPELNLCAIALFRKHEYVGMRVHNVTGVCEGLPREWTINRTMDNHHSYVKRIQTQQLYVPSLAYSNVMWKLPGFFRNGARLDVAGRMPGDYNDNTVSLNLNDGGWIAPFNLKPVGDILMLNEYVNNTWQGDVQSSSFDKLELTRAKGFRFSFVAEENSIRILLNGREIDPRFDPISPLSVITHFRGHAFDANRPLPSLSMLQFVNDID